MEPTEAIRPVAARDVPPATTEPAPDPAACKVTTFVEIRNFTGAHERAEAFIRAKCHHVRTEGLSLHIKFTRAKGRDFDGYYRLDDRRIVIAVKRRLRYPRVGEYGIATTPTRSRVARRPWKLVWHAGTFESADDLLVFAAGHEFWHFLCHTGQRTRDHETRANCNGFLWLNEFQRWQGPPEPVAPVALMPPRPDAASTGERPGQQRHEGRPGRPNSSDSYATSSAREEQWQQIELFPRTGGHG